MKNLLFALSILCLFACKKDDPKPTDIDTHTTANGSDTTEYAPVRYPNQMTCRIEEKYFAPLSSSGFKVDSAISKPLYMFEFYSYAYVTGNVGPYRKFDIIIPKDSVGFITLNSFNFVYYEGETNNVPAADSYLPGTTLLYVYQNSGGKVEATFWGVVKDPETNKTRKIQSGKLAFVVQ